ncbi:DNA-binding protein WhiA [Eupransor demetentiae]|uniref:Probable cell division protein WhiA n=1 Tax=Eupransor demetentiae TaxID=3109584 RepID=A0ABM9N5Y9_9LACO|nr:DNA-binding transcriptional regulator WhiA [Lactobacillaceae bacterium LMG 33000]
MSYAAEVKKELTGLIVDNPNAKAELSALLRMNGVNTLGSQHSIKIETENAAIARRIYSLLKQAYTDIEVEVKVGSLRQLSQRKSFAVLLKNKVDLVLDDLGVDPFGLNQTIPSRLINEAKKQRSFLRGAFLAAGSVNSPEKANYHLEIDTSHEELAEELLRLMNNFALPAKITQRQGAYMLYIKRAEKIVDFLATIGATQSMLHFEDIRMMRDMRNSVNRLVNAETANIQKTAVAANRQIDNIQVIQKELGDLDRLPAKLATLAKLRLEHPDESLAELGDLLEISKSGANHRMRKLSQLADKIKKEEPYDLEKL